MGESSQLIRGWVRNGMVVLEPGTNLPDGTEVRVELVTVGTPVPTPFTPEEKAEFEAWDRLSDKAWAMIDELERESVHTCPCCGYFGLSAPAYADLPAPPWSDLGSPPYSQAYGFPSYEVCPCCGFEFGNDDEPGTAAGATFAAYLREWIVAGCNWFDAEKRPSRWSLDFQLTAAGITNPMNQT